MTRTRVLDPVSRASEILFGLIMVLTFTASLNTAEAGRGDVRLMLIAALGCNLAWGVIDAAMYLLSVRAEGAISRRTLDRIKLAASLNCAYDEIRAALPPILAGLFDMDDLERIRLHLVQMDMEDVPRLTAGDWRAAGAVFLLVFCATLPVALPFMLIGEPRRALWVSHGIAIAALFLAGWSLGRHWLRPLRVGLAMVALGFALVATALLLGAEMRFIRAYANLSRAIIAAFAIAQVQALLLVCLLIASCQALVFRLVEGWGLLDGFYFSVVSMATVGYGDLAPETGLGKLLAMLFLMIGVGIFVLTVSSIAQAILHELSLSEHRSHECDGNHPEPD